ncbi:hypothetical protein CDAR_63941, partial [Caerostris darwini]
GLLRKDPKLQLGFHNGQIPPFPNPNFPENFHEQSFLLNPGPRKLQTSQQRPSQHMSFNKGYKEAFVLIVYEIHFHSRHEKHFQTDPLTRDWNSSTSQPNPWRLLEIAFLFGCPPALRTKGTESLEVNSPIFQTLL